MVYSSGVNQRCRHQISRVRVGQIISGISALGGSDGSRNLAIQGGSSNSRNTRVRPFPEWVGQVISGILSENLVPGGSNDFRNIHVRQVARSAKS